MGLDHKTLVERQGWTLNQKVYHSLEVIDTFVQRMGGKVFVSFSGGKDSTVLLDLCRRIKPDILAVFSNTGMEDPSLVRLVNERVKAGENIKVIRPAIRPREVWERYGFPLVSKETANKVHRIRYNPHSQAAQKWLDPKDKFCLPRRWHYLLEEPYDTNNACCEKLKKEPFHRFVKESGLSPILGTMASESKMRMGAYLRDGSCNTYDQLGGGKSKPLSIWLESDIWEYIRNRGLRIADIYGKGVKRTGCVACGFGSQFPDDNRFDVLMSEYPKLYTYAMNLTNGGVTYREALRKVLAVVGKTLPDEREMTLFDN